MKNIIENNCAEYTSAASIFMEFKNSYIITTQILLVSVSYKNSEKIISIFTNSRLHAIVENIIVNNCTEYNSAACIFTAEHTNAVYNVFIVL